MRNILSFPLTPLASSRGAPVRPNPRPWNWPSADAPGRGFRRPKSRWHPPWRQTGAFVIGNSWGISQSWMVFFRKIPNLSKSIFVLFHAKMPNLFLFHRPIVFFGCLFPRWKHIYTFAGFYGNLGTPKRTQRKAKRKRLGSLRGPGGPKVLDSLGFWSNNHPLWRFQRDFALIQSVVE